MDEFRGSTVLGTIYSPPRYLMQYRVCMSYFTGRERRRGLASDGGHNVGHPYTTCDRHDKLILVPNGDAVKFR
jgi:hypothetical protein